MTTAKATEQHIIRRLLDARGGVHNQAAQPLAERLIALSAATAGVFLLGSVLQELVWVALAAGAIVALGFPAVQGK